MEKQVKRLAAIVLISVAASGQPPKYLFHITGYSDDARGDCSHPAIAVYAYDRLDALRRMGISVRQGHVTVWTESEWLDMRKRIGKDWDEHCAATKAATPESEEAK